MNKAVVGIFADNISASRAINDLKAYGFGGETINQVLREDLTHDEPLAGPRIVPAMEILKGLIIGVIVGGVVGAIANWFLGMSLTWPSFGLSSPLYSAIFTMAAVDAVCGILEGLAAVGPLVAARRAIMMRRRGDAVVTVHTDETHAVRAADILRAAGATDVRRGASSVADEFRTVESVQPEAYGTMPVAQREPVELPLATGDVMETPAGGGAIE
ncbi:MAG: hypothetical protein ACHQ7M_09170 [Chloroflexota bacterium]